LAPLVEVAGGGRCQSAIDPGAECPAGALFYDGDRLIRPSQDCAKAYGYALVFSEVLSLTDTEYQERPIARLDPGWVRGNLGTHTYTRTEQFEAIDGNFPAWI
jgi:hypothetical protein